MIWQGENGNVKVGFEKCYVNFLGLRMVDEGIGGVDRRSYSL